MSFKNAHAVESLYIHWPFCPYKCSFCPFVAFSKMDRYMGAYQQALLQEIEQFAAQTDQNKKNKIKTIYIGGGTPSTWPDSLLLDMCAILKDKFDLAGLAEMTIEVNPGTVTQEQLMVWKNAGITRISAGVQSLNDQVLEKLTRYQKVADVYRLMEWVDGVYDSVSIDLILGLPEISDQEWKRQIEEIVKWPIKHLSVYFLSIHEGTALYFKVRRDAVILPPDDDVVDLYYWTIDKLAAHGFIQYEISSFAKPGYESKHNRAYWTRQLYKGFGVGAWSYDGECRFQNEKKLLTYIEAQEQHQSCLAYKEILDQDNVRFETIMLGLRTLEGFHINDALIGLDEVKRNEFFEKLAILTEQRLVKRVGDKIYLTIRAFSIENEVAVALCV